MQHQYVDCTFERDDGVAIFTLCRPERHNALSAGIREGLIQAAKEAEEDDGIKAVVITGSGKAFCTGADVNLEDASTLKAAQGRRGIKGPWSLPIMHINRLEKPVIAAVNGTAAGAGFGLALACDLRVISDNARFSSVFIRRGLAAEWGVSYFLPRLIGMPKALRLMWSGEMIGAGEAVTLGIADKVVPEADLMGVTMALARDLASGPSIAIELVKRLVYGSLQNSLPAQLAWEMQASGVCLGTDDLREGFQSFREKRAPLFRGT